MNLSKSRSTVEAPWPTSHRVSLIHDADAFLVGGRAAPPTNPCTGSRDNAPQKCSQFMELIGSVVVPVPADLHATCMNQFRVVWGRRYNLSSTAAPLGTPQRSATLAAAAKQSRSGRSRVRGPYSARSFAISSGVRLKDSTSMSATKTTPTATVATAAPPTIRAATMPTMCMGSPEAVGPK